ncbi:MAG: peptidylprolyl isomerase [Clostridia bacterium]|nr:peptidylprolyl isomerase [Clostridia bacterium]
MTKQTKSAPKKDKKTLLITIAVIVIAAIVIGLAIYARLDLSGSLLRSKTAMESPNFKVDGAMMAYFYGNQYQSYYPYLSYYGVDTKASLKTQTYSDGTTWFDFFLSTAKSSVTEILALCEGAKAAGITLDDADYASIEDNLKGIEATADGYGYTAEAYLSAMTGNTLRIKDVKKCLELSTLALKYRDSYLDSLSYTDEKLDEYFANNADTLNGVDYLSYTFSSSSFTTYGDNENPTSTAAEDSALAEETANKLKAASTADAFKSTLSEILTGTLEADEETVNTALDGLSHEHASKSSLASLNADLSEWAFGGASAGESYVVGKTGDTSFTVYLLTRAPYADDTQTRNVRHILFRNTENDGQYEDDAKAKEIYAEWEAAGFSEAKFLELVPLWSEDTGSVSNGGLYENVAPGRMVEEFNDWLFDDSRKPGDHDIVETTYGWHIMYYVGEGEYNAWQTAAISALQQEDYTAMVEEKSALVTAHDKVMNSING